MMYVLVTGKRGDQFEEVLKSLNDDLAIAEATATIRALNSHDRNDLSYADLYKVDERSYKRVQSDCCWSYSDIACGECWDIKEIADMMDSDDDEEFRVRQAYRNNWTDDSDWDGYVTKEDVIDLSYDWGVDASILFTQLMRI